MGDPGSSGFQKRNSGDYRCADRTLAAGGGGVTSSVFCSSQMRLLLHGGGTGASRRLQRHAHHLPAQTGRTLLPGLCQHLSPQGLPAPVSVELLLQLPARTEGEARASGIKAPPGVTGVPALTRTSFLCCQTAKLKVSGALAAQTSGSRPRPLRLRTFTFVPNRSPDFHLPLS